MSQSSTARAWALCVVLAFAMPSLALVPPVYAARAAAEGPGAPAACKKKKKKKKHKKKGGSKLSAKERKRQKKLLKKAKKLEKKGRAMYADGLWDDAISAFQLSWETVPRPEMLFNIGRCYENKGDLVAAVDHVRRYLDALGPDGPRDAGEEALALIEDKLSRSFARLKVTSRPPGAQVRLIAGEDAASVDAPGERWLAPGAWSLTASLEGYDDQTVDLVLEAGAVVEHAFEMVDPIAEAAAVAARQKQARLEAERIAREQAEAEEAAAARRQQAADAESARSTAWMVGGAGAAALLGGGVAGVLAMLSKSDFETKSEDGARLSALEEARDAAQLRSLAANVLYGAGVVAVGTAAVLLFLAPDPPGEAAADAPAGPVIDADEDDAVLLVPSLVDGGPGLSATVRF